MKTLRNNFYIVKLFCKAAPVKVAAELALCLLRNVITVWGSIWLLRMLLEQMEAGRGFEELLPHLFFYLCISGLVLLLDKIYYQYFDDIYKQKVQSRLDRMIFSKSLDIDLIRYQEPAFYDAYKRAAHCCDTVADMAYQNLLNAFGFAVMLLCGSSAVLLVDKVLFLFCAFPFLASFIMRRYNKRLYAMEREITPFTRKKEYVTRTVLLKDYAREIRLTNISRVLFRDLERASEETQAVLHRRQRSLFWHKLLLYQTQINSIYLLNLLYMTYKVAVTGELSLADFSVAFSSVIMVVSRIRRLMENYEKAQHYSQYIEDLRQFLRYSPGIRGGSLPPGAFESLELKNVSLSLSGKKLLRQVSFSVRRGEKVAVVGLNGSGKSTLLNVLLRLYDATEGEVLYNGVNNKSYELEAYRKRFSCLFQDFQLFDLSVIENVLCREAGGDADRAKVRSLLRAGGLYEKVSAQPRGGDTVLNREFDPDGLLLSGGERQKLAFARMMARDFDIAILDEPTAALDAVSEERLYDTIFQELSDKTVFYVTHRLSAAVRADKVLVFREGVLAEHGSHAELMRLGGLYAEMFHKQAESYLA